MFETYIVLSVIIVALFVFLKNKLFIYLLLNKGDVIYKDTVGAKLYRDKEYGVSSKPDRISRYGKRNFVIEYKSRKKGIFEKDIIQALSGALASWELVGGINEVVVYNGSYKYKRVKIRSKKALYKKLRKHIENARKIKQGETVKSRVIKDNCRVCPFNNNCKWATKR